MKKNDWKDLEIGEIPRDFFVNERYEIELYNSTQKERGWKRIEEDSITSYRITILDDINTQSHLHYRYRLKPLEIIKVKSMIMKPDGNITAVKESGEEFILEIID